MNKKVQACGLWFVDNLSFMMDVLNVLSIDESSNNEFDYSTIILLYFCQMFYVIKSM